jgi:hypothetical protein
MQNKMAAMHKVDREQVRYKTKKDMIRISLGGPLELEM